MRGRRHKKYICKAFASPLRVFMRGLVLLGIWMLLFAGVSVRAENTAEEAGQIGVLIKTSPFSASGLSELALKPGESCLLLLVLLDPPTGSDSSSCEIRVEAEGLADDCLQALLDCQVQEGNRLYLEAKEEMEEPLNLKIHVSLPTPDGLYTGTGSLAVSIISEEPEDPTVTPEPTEQAGGEATGEAAGESAGEASEEAQTEPTVTPAEKPTEEAEQTPPQEPGREPTDEPADDEKAETAKEPSDGENTEATKEPTPAVTPEPTMEAVTVQPPASADAAVSDPQKTEETDASETQPDDRSSENTREDSAETEAEPEAEAAAQEETGTETAEAEAASAGEAADMPVRLQAQLLEQEEVEEEPEQEAPLNARSMPFALLLLGIPSGGILMGLRYRAERKG